MKRENRISQKILGYGLEKHIAKTIQIASLRYKIALFLPVVNPENFLFKILANSIDF